MAINTTVSEEQLLLPDRNQFQDHRSITSTPVFQCFLSYVLVFLIGSTFALGLFTVPVEQAAVPPHSLDGIWEYSMGLVHFSSAPLTILASFFLKYFTSISRTTRIRIMTSVSTISFAMLSLSSFAVKYNTPTLLIFSVGMNAFPLAINYILASVLLVLWVPDRTGLAIGFSMVSFGLGSIFNTQLFEMLITKYGVLKAIPSASAILFLLSLLPVCFTKWPPENVENNSNAESHTVNHDESITSHRISCNMLSWTSLLSVRQFWLFVLLISSAGASYMLNPYYYKLGLLFNQPTSVLKNYYQITDAIATIANLIIAYTIDSFSIPNTYWFSGARNLIFILISLQTLLFLAMTRFSQSKNFVGYIITNASLKTLMICHEGLPPLLARDFFGKENLEIVVGFGAGLALGTGEGLSAWLMSAVEMIKTRARGPDLDISDYNAFFYIAALWSFIGCLCCMILSRSPKIFNYQPSKPFAFL